MSLKLIRTLGRLQKYHRFLADFLGLGRERNHQALASVSVALHALDQQWLSQMRQAGADPRLAVAFQIYQSCWSQHKARLQSRKALLEKEKERLEQEARYHCHRIKRLEILQDKYNLNLRRHHQRREAS